MLASVVARCAGSTTAALAAMLVTTSSAQAEEPPVREGSPYALDWPVFGLGLAGTSLNFVGVLVPMLHRRF